MAKQARAMPKWRPSPDTLVRRFARAMAAIAGAEMRKMFGYPAAFLRGNMFAGLFQDVMILRLSPEDRADVSRRLGAKPFAPRPGRPMREYVVVPRTILTSPSELQRWLAKARAYATSLPPKARRPAPRKHA